MPHAQDAGRPIPRVEYNPSMPPFLLILIGSGRPPPVHRRIDRALLGLAAILWYNGFYTWLKAHNALQRSRRLVGAIPPAIGWAAGVDASWTPGWLRSAFSSSCGSPHFLIHQQAFGKEYEEIHLPSLTAVFTGAQLDRLLFQWLLAAAVSLQLVVFYGLIQSTIVHISLLAASVWFVARG